MPRIGVRYGKHFIAGALATLVDFVGIGGAPVVGGRQFESPARFGCLCHGSIRIVIWLNGGKGDRPAGEWDCRN
jgi:hypothetical protein